MEEKCRREDEGRRWGRRKGKIIIREGEGVKGHEKWEGNGK